MDGLEHCEPCSEPVVTPLLVVGMGDVGIECLVRLKQRVAACLLPSGNTDELLRICRVSFLGIGCDEEQSILSEDELFDLGDVGLDTHKIIKSSLSLLARRLQSLFADVEGCAYSSCIHVHIVTGVCDDAMQRLPDICQLVNQCVEHMGLRPFTSTHGYLFTANVYRSVKHSLPTTYVRPLRTDDLQLDSIDLIGTDYAEGKQPYDCGISYDKALNRVVDRILAMLGGTQEGQTPFGLPEEVCGFLSDLFIRFGEYQSNVIIPSSDVETFVATVLPCRWGFVGDVGFDVDVSTAQRFRQQVDCALCDIERGPAWVQTVLAARDVISLRGALDDALRQNELCRQKALRESQLHDVNSDAYGLEQYKIVIKRCDNNEVVLRSLQVQLDQELERCGILVRWMARIQDEFRKIQWGGQTHVVGSLHHVNTSEAFRTYVSMLLLHEHVWLYSRDAEATVFLRSFVDVLVSQEMNQNYGMVGYGTETNSNEVTDAFDALGTASSELFLADRDTMFDNEEKDYSAGME